MIMDICLELLGNKVNHVEEDLHSGLRQLALLQAFIRHKFDNEFKEFAETNKGRRYFFSEKPAAPSSLSAHELQNNQDSRNSTTVPSETTSVIATAVTADSQGPQPEPRSPQVMSFINSCPEGSAQTSETTEEDNVENRKITAAAEQNSACLLEQDEFADVFQPSREIKLEQLDEKFVCVIDEIDLEEHLDYDASEDLLLPGTFTLSAHSPIAGTSTASQPQPSVETFSGVVTKTSTRSTSISARTRLSQKQLLQQQQQSERIRKLFQCQQCLKVFTRDSSLARHKNVHKDKRLKCSSCPKSFVRLDNYKRHKITMHKESNEV